MHCDAGESVCVGRSRGEWVRVQRTAPVWRMAWAETRGKGQRASCVSLTRSRVAEQGSWGRWSPALKAEGFPCAWSTAVPVSSSPTLASYPEDLLLLVLRNLGSPSFCVKSDVEPMAFVLSSRCSCKATLSLARLSLRLPAGTSAQTWG